MGSAISDPNLQSFLDFRDAIFAKAGVTPQQAGAAQPAAFSGQAPMSPYAGDSFGYGYRKGVPAFEQTPAIAERSVYGNINGYPTLRPYPFGLFSPNYESGQWLTPISKALPPKTPALGNIAGGRAGAKAPVQTPKTPISDVERTFHGGRLER